MTTTKMPRHTGDPCPNCDMETDTDKCGPLYCPTCNWQSRPCEHQEPMKEREQALDDLARIG